MLEAVVVLLSFAAFPVLWIGALTVFGRLGAWGALAARFATDAPPSAEGVAFRGISGYVGASRYKNALHVWVQPDGLRLGVSWILSPGHPPLLLPWHEVAAVERHRVLFGADVYEVTLGVPEITKVRLPERVVEAMRDILPMATRADDAPRA